MILCYDLSDQEDLTLHQVEAHDVRAFAASKALQSDISLEQILSACLWKSHNTFTQLYLKDVAWADLELSIWGQWWLLSRSTRSPRHEEICIYFLVFKESTKNFDVHLLGIFFPVVPNSYLSSPT